MNATQALLRPTSAASVVSTPVDSQTPPESVQAAQIGLREVAHDELPQTRAKDSGEGGIAGRTQGILRLSRLGKGAVAAAMIGASFFISPTPAAAQDPCAIPRQEQAQMSGDERQLRTKVCRLVQRSFDGNLDRAFTHYAGRDAAIDRNELGHLLEDAGVGNLFTRGAWVSGVIEKFDAFPGAIRNGKVDRVELDHAMGRSASRPSPSVAEAPTRKATPSEG